MSAETPQPRRLVALYRSYLGEPDRTVDVYVGFGLFFAAVAAAVFAFATFVYSTQFSGAELYAYREPAFALGMVSLPFALLAIVVLLPVDRRGVAGALLGTVGCLAAVGGFVYAYPYRWDVGPGPQYSIEVMVGYGLGLSVLLVSTGAALVAYHIERARPHPNEFEPVEDEPEEDVSEERVEQDIEEAMSNVELNWGGATTVESSRLSLGGSDFDDVEVSGADVAATKVESSGVDAQVQGLKTVKGGERKTARSETTVDDQTARLAELRKEKEADPESTGRGGLVGRIAGLLGRRSA